MKTFIKKYFYFVKINKNPLLLSLGISIALMVCYLLKYYVILALPYLLIFFALLFLVFPYLILGKITIHSLKLTKKKKLN